MLKKILSGYASGAVGGAANVLFLVVAGLVGLPALLGLVLPDFANAAFLYKQVFWGGLWALLFVTPIMPNNWLMRGVVVGVAASAVALFVFFPIGTTDGVGPGIAGLNIGPLMPVYVLIANLCYGLVASRIYKYLQE